MKVALVTGGSRGIGAAIVQRLAQDGYCVVFTYLKHPVEAANVVRSVERDGGKCHAYKVDVTDPGRMFQVVETAARLNINIDVLVNNAGTVIDAPLGDFDPEQIESLFTLNVLSLIQTTKQVLPHMTTGGRIVNIGSNVGERVSRSGLSVYAATKGAVRSFTQGLSRELSPRGITVNCIAPGSIATDLNPAIPGKPHGQPRDVAALVSLLVSSAGDFITGSSFTVDGGINA